VVRHARTIGVIIVGIGLAVVIGFTSVAISGMGDFNKAKLVRERNPGNAMYDLQFFIATVQLAFVVSGAVGGVLLTVNGLTWLALGGALRRLEQDRPARAGGAT
jgi:hypothetical protein